MQAKSLHCATMLLLCLAIVVPLSAGDILTETNESALIQVLQSDSPTEDKALVCKRLAIYGTERSVPALASLLPNPELSSWSRIALEAIPDIAAVEALNEATKQVRGRQLVGVVNSIAVRASKSSINDLLRLMASDDEQVVAAAAIALGKIGEPLGINGLQIAIQDSRPAVRDAAGEGCIYAAEKLAAAGKQADAAKLYQRVRESDVSRPRKFEATRGVVLTVPEFRGVLLNELLRSNDKHSFRLGLNLAREVPGDSVTEELGQILDRLPPKQQPFLLSAIADRQGASVMPIILRVLISGSADLKRASLEALAKIGDKSAIPAVMTIATAGDKEMSHLAIETLAALPDKDTSSALQQRLESSLGAERLVLLELAGKRRLRESLPSVLAATKDPAAETRQVALVALGTLAGLEHLPTFLDALVSNPSASAIASSAMKGLEVCCLQIKDRDACAEKLKEAMATVELPQKLELIRILGAMEGATALRILANEVTQGSSETQDAASKELGEWMTPDAAETLLELAEDPKAAKFQVRALRGMIRILRQFVMEQAEREDLARRAFSAAKRNEERSLVLEVLQRYPSQPMLAIAVDAAQSAPDDMKPACITAVVSIAAQLGLTPEVRGLLAKLGGKGGALEIIKAQYGADQSQKDVTSIVQQHEQDFPLILLPGDYNQLFGGDPAPNIRKQLTIEYTMEGKAGTARFEENAPVWLPVP